jgi:hypothetical protein
MIVLIGVLAAFLAGLWVLDVVTTSRRSATADIRIVSSDFQPGGGFEQTPQGTNIRYEYVVDGSTYVGSDFRPWSDVPAHHPKVCSTRRTQQTICSSTTGCDVGMETTRALPERQRHHCESAGSHASAARPCCSALDRVLIRTASRTKATISSSSIWSADVNVR